MKLKMQTLVYKRTHKHDPDSLGRFGIQDCMGQLRSSEFDAVIGIGGICLRAQTEGISRKLNWIGIGPRKQWIGGMRGPLVTFDHFLLFEDDGANFEALAPALAHRLYFSKAPRFLFSGKLNRTEQEEVKRILKRAEAAPPSARRHTASEEMLKCFRKNDCSVPTRHPCGSQEERRRPFLNNTRGRART